MTNILNMSPHIKETFYQIKPLCDLVFKDPSPVNLSRFSKIVEALKKDAVQELQQYLLFPFTSHLQADVNIEKYELHLRMVESMKEVLQRVRVSSYEMCLKVESLLLKVIFDKNQPGMIADVPEELKLSVVQCLTILMLNIDQVTRIKMLETQVPILAQAIFVSVHLAKLEKLRNLRLAAINCLAAHTMTHSQLTDKNYHITDPLLEIAVVNMMACILPGVLAALQDVATCPDNPGHAIVVAALSATHRVLCIIMHNKHLYKKNRITAEDFVHLLEEKVKGDKDVSTKVPKAKDIPKRTPEWYAMASEKLVAVVKNLAPLVTHEHFKVRRELAVLCYRILSECSATMQPSLAMALDVLITLSTDPYKEVSEYCARAVDSHFTTTSTERKIEAIDSLCENFFTTLNCLPRILNNIDSSRKLSVLSLLHGYLQILCDGGRPQRLTSALSASDGFDRLCDALLAAADLQTDLTLLTRHASRGKLSVLSLLHGYLQILCDGGRPQRLTSALSASDGFDRLCDALLAAADLQTDLTLLTRHASRGKLSVLSLLHGYLQILCDGGRPQRLTSALSASDGFDRLCDALLAAADLQTDLTLLTRHASRGKLSVLSLLHGYLQILCDGGRPQRLTSALSASDGFDRLCDALLAAADLQTDLTLLTRHASRGKLSVLSLLHGYLQILCDGGRPQRLTSALSASDGFDRLCDALLAAADLQTDLTLLTRHASRGKLSVLSLLHGYLQILCDGGRPQRLTSALSASDGFDRLCDALLAAADLQTDLTLLTRHASRGKLSVLSLLHGYLQILCDGGRPQRLTSALSASDGFDRLCDALLAAADLQTDLTLLTRHASRDVTSPPSSDTPWCRLRHLDSKELEQQLQRVCRALGGAECAELFLDRLLELFHERRSCELVYVINWFASAPNSSPNLAKRVISTYIAEDIWYLPLEVSRADAPVSRADTLDAAVYDPRAWTKDSVPGLYEGATETRYTDISYGQPRTRYVEPNTCGTLGEARRNMACSCLVTEGLGLMARRLREDYQPYLLKTLCLILERVGSEYENLHLTGLKAINDVAFAFGHASVTELIADNADYFTSQITSRLKKAWNTQSALQILSVVMEYSDSSILDYLNGIVEDVLVQCCDKYYERHLYAYLQVFLTFITCIRKWFLHEEHEPKETQAPEIDVMQDVIEFVRNKREAERLLTTEELEREKEMTVDEMYKEDMKKREEEVLDYDDTVAEESPPPPQHIKVTVTILKRCINFIPSNGEETLLALRILTLGLPVLKEYENELLPLVHLTWAPLVGRFESADAAILRCAFDLFVVLAALSKDFLRNRAVRDVLQQMYKFLKRSAQESHLKDAGSAYRLSAAYRLQLAALDALPALAADLALDEDRLVDAMACAQAYLSNKQPKPLQMLAVRFFKEMLSLSYGCAWYHLRRLCRNAQVLEPPPGCARLAPVCGTPYETSDPDYDTNVKLIFYVHK